MSEKTIAENAGNDGRKMMKVGLYGSLVAAVCCFTPVLVIGFGVAGLSGLIGGIDYVVFPLLFTFMGVIAHALYLQSPRRGTSPKLAIAILVVVFSAGLLALKFRFLYIILGLAVALLVGYALYLRRGNERVAK